MAKTKKPSGLAIARNKNVFACSWKLGEKYSSDQQWATKTSATSWSKAASIGKTTSKKSLTINFASYYPTTTKKLTSVSFKVRGKKKNHKWSAWVSKSYTITAPNAPTVNVTPDSSTANKCSFSWSLGTNDTNAQPFINMEYQSMLIANSNTADGSTLAWKSSQPGWKTGVVANNSNVVITETAGSIATGSHTRWFRIRSRGPGGASAWRYGRRVYAAPNKATVTEAKYSNTASGGTQVNLKWSNTVNQAYPAETVDIEYCIAVPVANLGLPANASWTKATTLANTTNKAASITVPTALDVNQVLWVRVNPTHIDKTTEGAAKLVRAGYIEAPSIQSISTDATTYRATITVNNPTTIPDAFIVVQYRTGKAPNKVANIGVIPHGSTTITVQCPNWTNQGGVDFGIYANVGTYKVASRADGVSSYTITTKMRSQGTVWEGGSVPQAPKSVAVATTDSLGTVRVTWDWPWKEATGAVISWADHEDAWESTDAPSTYEITNVQASAWNIAGLESGKRWYVRVRLTNGDVIGDWSNMASIDLSSAPETPTLVLSSGIIPANGIVSASWSYISTDGTGQAYAKVCEYVNGTYSDPIIAVSTAQSGNIYAEDQGWNVGETHLLAVKVTSASRVEGEWSTPVPVTIAEPLSVTVEQISLVEETETVDGDERTYLALKEMPFTATITGAGAGGVTTLIIERAADYHVDRPDETDFNGYKGETIAIFTQTGEAQITINRTDLLGKLDDGAAYNVIATVQDGLGQSASTTIPFEVHWTHQAVFPLGDVAILNNDVAIISPYKPEGWAEGDTCDIYRLSADKPELIYEGAEFGTVYVDPYPAIGEFAGHRIVYKTIDGDYITEDNEIAWLDILAEDGDTIKADYSIIDYDGEQIFARWNMDISSSWEKSFIETQYLGGTITGDWNKGVKQKSSLKAIALTTRDADTIKAVRLLGQYDGICHIRTVDGASYACNIEVSGDMSYKEGGQIYSYSLSINRVNPDSLDGLTYAEWLGEDEAPTVIIETVVSETEVISWPALGTGDN